MKKYLILSTAILALTLFVNSSSAQNNPLFRHISPDANAAYHINLPAILSKVSLADMIARIPSGKHGNDKSQDIMEFLKDPNLTGANINQDILITSSNADFVDSPSYMTIVLHLSDTSKFRIFLAKNSHGLHIARYPDKSFSAHKDKEVIAWNKDLAVITLVTPPIKSMMTEAAGMGKMKDAKKEPGTATKPKDNWDNWKEGGHEWGPALDSRQVALAVSKTLATLKGWDFSPIADDPEFKTAFSDNSDFQMYSVKMNYIKALTKILPHGLLGGLALDSLSMYKHSITTVRFENGRIIMHSTTEMLPHMAADLEKFPAPPSEDLLAGLPKDQLLGFIDLRLNLRMIGYMLDRIGVRRKVDSAMAETKLSLDDFYHAFKGDLLIAVLLPSHADSFQRPKPSFYSVISVGDPVALGKITETFKTAKQPMTDDSTGKMPSKFDKFKDNFVMKNNLLVFSDSKASAEGYFSSTEKRGKDALTDAVKENPTYLWVDLQAVINGMFGPANSDEGADQKMKFMNGLHILDKMILKKGGLHDGKVSSSFELTVTNKDQNILKTLFDLIPESKH